MVPGPLVGKSEHRAGVKTTSTTHANARVNAPSAPKLAWVRSPLSATTSSPRQIAMVV